MIITKIAVIKILISSFICANVCLALKLKKNTDFNKKMLNLELLTN